MGKREKDVKGRKAKWKGKAKKGPKRSIGLWNVDKQIRKSDSVIKEFGDQFLSESSRGPKASRTALVSDLLTKINEPKPAVPITCRALKALKWKANGCP